MYKSLPMVSMVTRLACEKYTGDEMEKEICTLGTSFWFLV